MALMFPTKVKVFKGFATNNFLRIIVSTNKFSYLSFDTSSYKYWKTLHPIFILHEGSGI